MSASIQADCRSLKGRSLDEIATGMVDAMIAAKWRRLEVSRAMHEPLVEVGGAELVRASAAKGASLVADLLRSCPEIGGVDVEPLAVFLVMACTSMLQAAFIEYSADKETIRAHMHAMVCGYLREMRAR
jgi:Tetracyclin repressor-like, C-terminal domain